MIDKETNLQLILELTVSSLVSWKWLVRYISEKLKAITLLKSSLANIRCWIQSNPVKTLKRMLILLQTIGIINASLYKFQNYALIAK